MGKIADISEVLLELGLSSSATDEERAIANSAITRAEAAIRRHIFYDPVERTRTEYYPQSENMIRSRGVVWETEGDQAFLRQVANASAGELQIQNIPIRSITQLFVDFDGRAGTRATSFAASTLKVEGTDYWPNNDGFDSSDANICRDGIIRSGGLWPTTPGTVKIVYVAGYTAAELHGQDNIVDAMPILDAVIDEAVRRTKKAFLNMKKTGAGWTAGPFTSETLGDYRYQIDSTLSARLFGSSFDITSESKEKISSFVNFGWALSS